MTSIASVHLGRRILLCCSPKVYFLFLPVKVFFSLFFALIRCEVMGQGCHMCTDCNAVWGKFVIWGYKKNTFELNEWVKCLTRIMWEGALGAHIFPQSISPWSSDGAAKPLICNQCVSYSWLYWETRKRTLISLASCSPGAVYKAGAPEAETVWGGRAAARSAQAYPRRRHLLPAQRVDEDGCVPRWVNDLLTSEDSEQCVTAGLHGNTPL